MDGGYRAVEFASQGYVLRGRLYLPEERPAPLVIMAHGFSATVPMVLDRYAEVFHANGVAVLAFDHPGLGESGGEPRGEINPWVSARGYMSALDFAASLPEIDPSRIAVWGDSMSSRVAFVVAALDDRVKGLVCQVPAMGDSVPSPAGQANGFEAIAEFVRDGAVRRAPETWTELPVVSTDQNTTPSALLPLTAFRWFIEYGGRYGTGWVNRVVLTSAVDGPPFDPFACAGNIRIPTLFVMSPQDEMPGARSDVARELLERVPGPTEVVEVAGGHFGIIEYPSDAFHRASSAQAAFLNRLFAPTPS